MKIDKYIKMINKHTSVFSDNPLLKNISDTAIYLTVISGLNGPIIIIIMSIIMKLYSTCVYSTESIRYVSFV